MIIRGFLYITYQDKITRLFCEGKAPIDIKKYCCNAAQKVYDAWLPDEEGGVVVRGHGGICHDIADAIVGVLDTLGIEGMSYHQEVGENHTFVVAKFPNGIFSIDIPPGVYETGSGYTWTKKPGIVFSPDDVDISLITKDLDRWSEYEDQ